MTCRREGQFVLAVDTIDASVNPTQGCQTLLGAMGSRGQLISEQACMFFMYILYFCLLPSYFPKDMRSH